MGKLRIVASLVLCCAFVGVAGAAAPGLFDRLPGIYPVASEDADRFAGVSVGKPPGLAALASWILGGERPAPENFILPKTHLRSSDIIVSSQEN